MHVAPCQVLEGPFCCSISTMIILKDQWAIDQISPHSSAGQCHCTAAVVALDSLQFRMDVQVMTVVKGLAKTGTTICATIHSPSSHCFSLFDRIMMLLRGHLVYAGPNGESALLSQQLQYPHRQGADAHAVGTLNDTL